jgi:hypothetical protein
MEINMESKRLAIIGDLATPNGVVKVVKGFSDRTIDPVGTQKRIDEAKVLDPNLNNIKETTLFKTYAVYLAPSTGRKILTEDELAALEEKFDWLEPHQELTEGGEIIPNWIGTEYWEKENGRWEKIKIEMAGIAVPSGGILPDALSPEQRQEISGQEEADRIAALSPEQRSEEVQRRLAALADEAVALEKRAQIQGSQFDAAAWYQEKKAALEAKYGAAA